MTATPLLDAELARNDSPLLRAALDRDPAQRLIAERALQRRDRLSRAYQDFINRELGD